METHVMSMRDEGDRLYHAVVLAPDHATARRVFAKRMLEDFERTLAGSGEASLSAYAPEGSLEDDWQAEGSVNCTSCGNGTTRPLENVELALLGISPIIHQGKGHVCLSCAATWITTGPLLPLRERLEQEAAKEVDGLDDFERRSLEEDDQ